MTLMHSWRGAQAPLALPFLIGAVFVLAPGPSQAAEPDAPTEIDQLVVTHEEVDDPIGFEDTAVETEVLTLAEVEGLPATNAADAVRLLPGIRLQRRVQGEEAAVSIEGMPPSYTRVLVNGERYSGEIGAVDDLRDVPLTGVERIEILRGAQGLRFGPEAAGGVLNIVTQSAPEDGWAGSIDSGWGSDHKAQGAGTLAYGTPTLGGTLAFTHDQIDGYEAPENLERSVFVPSGRESRRLSRDAYGTFRWSPSSALELRTRAGFRREDEDFVFDAGAPLRRDQQRWLISQQAILDLDGATTVRARVGWFSSETRSAVGRRFALDEDELSLELFATHDLRIGPLQHEISFGADWRRPRLKLRQDMLPGDIDARLTPDDVNQSHDATGIHLADEIRFGETLRLELGTRLQLHSEFDAKILPQAAIVWTPWSTAEGGLFRLRASYGRNYRLPSLRDLHQPPSAQLGGAYFLSGNESLTPETSTSLRFGFEWSPKEGVLLSGVAFHNDIEDHIRSNFAGSLTTGTRRIDSVVPVVVPPGLALVCQVTSNFFPECGALGATTTALLDLPVTAQLFRKTNLDSVETRGIEARARFRTGFGLDLDFGYTLLDTEVTASNVNLTELPNEAKHVADARATFRLPVTQTEVSIRARWRDRALIETSGTGLLSFGTLERSDPSLTVDARLTQPLGDDFALYLDINNLTDERFVDSYVVRGRTFFVGMRARFD